MTKGAFHQLPILNQQTKSRLHHDYIIKPASKICVKLLRWLYGPFFQASCSLKLYCCVFSYLPVSSYSSPLAVSYWLIHNHLWSPKSHFLLYLGQPYYYLIDILYADDTATYISTYRSNCYLLYAEDTVVYIPCMEAIIWHMF